MGRKPAKRPSFFKIVFRKDFTRLLRLPPLFMQKYETNLPKKVKLRMEEWGRTWDVKVEEMKDGVFCFSGGWAKFAKDVGLKFGEFLVFNLNDGGFSVVDVCVYETSGCVKEFPEVCIKEEDDVENESKIKNHNTPEKAGAKVWSWKRSSPNYYEIVLKPHQRSRMTPLRRFARAAGLMGKERVEVVGEYRNVWVTLDHGLSDALRVDMAQGWGHFRTANKLVFGKTYSLEYKHKKDVIKVKEVKN